MVSIISTRYVSFSVKLLHFILQTRKVLFYLSLKVQIGKGCHYDTEYQREQQQSE